MKKICLLSIALFLVCTVNAQTEFTVPTPTYEEKYNTVKPLMFNTLLSLITVTKNDEITAEELGKKAAVLAFPYWDENSEYDQFVNFSINWFACIGEDVKLIEQSNEKIVIMVSSIYKRLEDEGSVFGTSVEEYTAFLNAIMSEIAAHIGYSFEQTWGEEGYRIVITK